MGVEEGHFCGTVESTMRSSTVLLASHSVTCIPRLLFQLRYLPLSLVDQNEVVLSVLVPDVCLISIIQPVYLLGGWNNGHVQGSSDIAFMCVLREQRQLGAQPVNSLFYASKTSRHYPSLNSQSRPSRLARSCMLRWSLQHRTKLGQKD